MKTQMKASILGATLSALTLSGFTAAPAQAAPGDQAVITVSKSSGLNPDGETVTITGAGFVSNGALTNGTRPPLAGTFSGFYVSFGKFQDVWRPSAGAPSGNRKSTQSDATRTNWLVPAANLATVGGAAGGGVTLAPDGTFSVTLNVSKTLIGSANAVVFNEATIGNYGIYTYGASGANYAPFETFTPLSFQAATDVAPQSSVVASPSTSPTLATRVSNRVQFTSGSTKTSNATKKELLSKVGDYKIASKVVITASAGITTGVSNKTIKSLAKKRANAIKKYLVLQGVPSEKIQIKTKLVKAGITPSTSIVAIP